MARPESPVGAATVELTAAARDIVERALDEVRHVHLSPTRVRVQTELLELGRRRDYQRVFSGVNRLAAELGEIGDILRRCADDLQAEEERIAYDDPGGDVWWINRLHAVARALAGDDPDHAYRKLAGAWVNGLTWENWDWCRRLLELPEVPPVSAERMRAVTDALAHAHSAAALDPIDALLDTAMGDAAAVRLGVLRTRILNREFSDRELLRQAADATVARAEGGPSESLALAVLAETQLAVDDVDAARATVGRMTRLAGASGTDEKVASALLFERGSLWALADELYDRAVADDPDATRAILLRPVPARLLVRAAVAERTAPADSLELLQRALDEGVPGDDDAALREIYEVRADRLVTLAIEEERQGRHDEAGARRTEAAHSLAEAARRFSAAQLADQALDCLRRACELAPDVAEFHWSYGEELRLDALHGDGTVDRVRMDQADGELREGLALREPGDGEAWVLVSLALIWEALGGVGEESAVLIERALLREPDYPAAYGFLVRVLRRRGFHQEAYEAMADGPRAAGSQRVLFEEQVALLLDRGLYDEALRVVELQSLLQPDEQDYIAYRAYVLLRKHRPEEALSVLAALEATNWVRIVRGQCLFETGQAEAARAEFWTLWMETVAGPAGDVAGWAAYRVGLLDEAITRYEDLRKRAPVHSPYTRDLGQMLLVRGDVTRGKVLLIEGIDACPYPGELRYLVENEFPYLRHAVRDAAHEAKAAEVLDACVGRVEDRRRELLDRRRDGEALDASLAAARAALHEGRPTEALAAYERLRADRRVPEAAEATLRAGRETREAADKRYAAGERDQARRAWEAAERAVGADSDLLRSLVCRRMVADLQDGTAEGVSAWLEGASGEPGIEETLAGAFRTLAFDATHLWVLHDRLLELRDRPGRSSRARHLLDRCAEQLPLDDVYHLGRAPADTSRPTFLSLHQLELKLGAVAQELCYSAELNVATANLRQRIEEDTGVRLPWIYAVPGAEVPDRDVDVQIYFRSVGRLELPAAREDWIPAIFAELEARLRDYLFRLVGVDDVALWLKGWEPESGNGPAWDPPDPRADRLRLARILRMLLREGVSVRDRGAIVSRVRNPVGVDTRGESATLETLRGVRERLGAPALGVEPGAEVVPLPPALESRVAEGLRDGVPVWELSRPRAYRIVTDLRSWLLDQPRRPKVLSVSRPDVRPFVWRLLAAERPAVHVVSESELSHG